VRWVVSTVCCARFCPFVCDAPTGGLDAVRPRTDTARVNGLRRDPERKKIERKAAIFFAFWVEGG
jgi:hypothetical protein